MTFNRTFNERTARLHDEAWRIVAVACLVIVSLAHFVSTVRALTLYLRHARPEYERLFQGVRGALREFWAREAQQPWAERWATELQQPLHKKPIPTGLHGDDVAYTKRGSILIVSLNGVLCRTRGSRLPLFALDLARCTDTTIEEIFKVLRWSFDCYSAPARLFYVYRL